LLAPFHFFIIKKIFFLILFRYLKKLNYPVIVI
jgi:hypothetical protein